MSAVSTVQTLFCCKCIVSVIGACSALEDCASSVYNAGGLCWRLFLGQANSPSKKSSTTVFSKWLCLSVRTCFFICCGLEHFTPSTYILSGLKNEHRHQALQGIGKWGQRAKDNMSRHDEYHPRTKHGKDIVAVNKSTPTRKFIVIIPQLSRAPAPSSALCQFSNSFILSLLHFTIFTGR